MSFDFNAYTEKQKTKAFSIIFDNNTSKYHLYKPSADVLAILTNLGFHEDYVLAEASPCFVKKTLARIRPDADKVNQKSSRLLFAA